MILFLFFLIRILFVNVFYESILFSLFILLILILIYEPRIKIQIIFEVFLNIEYLSYFLFLTTLIIFILSYISTFKENNFKKKILLVLLLIINLIIFRLITVLNQFIFYVFFEISVIPIFLIISGWGYQPERLFASYALLFYTIIFSCPLIINILLGFYYNFSFDLLGIMKLNFNLEDSFTINICSFIIIGGFLVKIPLYLIHIWLPKAHVEAPIFGSIELAGILLKLGGIGLIRFSILIKSFIIIDYLIMLRAIGALFISISCLIIIDIKVIIALSSVIHIRLVIIIFLLINEFRIIICIFIIITHAFRSSGIFFIAYIFYLNSNSRRIIINKGLLSLNPIITFIWIIVIISCISAPPRVNLFAEVLSIISYISQFKYLILIIVLSIIISTAYSLIIYSFSQQGKLSTEIIFFYNISHKYITLLRFFHLFTIVFIIFIIINLIV